MLPRQRAGSMPTPRELLGGSRAGASPRDSDSDCVVASGSLRRLAASAAFQERRTHFMQDLERTHAGSALTPVDALEVSELDGGPAAHACTI